MSISTAKKIARLLIGNSENTPDIRFATGLSIPDDFIWLSDNEGNPMAFFSDLEIDRARAQIKAGVSVIAEKEFGSTRSEIIINAAQQHNITTVEVPAEFPLGLAEKLRAAGLTLIISENSSFFPEREFKTPAEVSAITVTQRAGEAGFLRAVEVLSASSIGANDALLWQNEPLTSEVLRAEIDCAILRCGMLPTGTICAGGAQSAQPHNSGSGQLYAHTPIVMDIFPRSPATGYWGDLTRTVIKGNAPAIVRKAWLAVREARDHAKSLIRIGAIPSELHLKARNILDSHGFFTGETDGKPFGFFHGLGHGVGLEIHEAPRVSPRSSVPLKGGEVITIEPGLYYPEWGGIRLEDLVYLPASGTAQCLTAAPDIMEIE